MLKFSVNRRTWQGIRMTALITPDSPEGGREADTLGSKEVRSPFVHRCFSYLSPLRQITINRVTESTDIYYNFWGCKVQDQDAARFDYWWEPSSWLADCHLLCMLTWQGERGLCPVFSSSSYKDINPIIRTPLSWPYLNLITSQRSHLRISLHWGLEFQQRILGRCKQSITMGVLEKWDEWI